MKHNKLSTRNIINSDNVAGFTLIELMIVVVVLAIISAIALPSYRHYLINNAENEAQVAIQNQAFKLKRWRAKALNYKGFNTKIDPADSNPPCENVVYMPSGSDSSNYNYMLTIVDGDETTKPLCYKPKDKDSKVKGQNWVMIATPNPTGTFKNAKTYLIKSQGQRCYVDHTYSLTVDSDCNNTSGAQAW